MTIDIRPPGLYLRRFGAGTRRALALHCTLGHGGSWAGVAQALSPQATVLAPDLPGHGRSADVPADADLHDLCTARAAEFLTERMDVIGHSFGATVALRLALEQPEKIRSLTLVEPVLFAALKQNAPDTLMAHRHDSAEFEAAMAAQDGPQAARLFNRSWGDGTPWQDFPSQARTYMTDRIDLVARQAPALLEDRPGITTPGRLEALTLSVLLIEGSRTPPVVHAIHDALAARLPKARRAVIDGAGHMSVLTHPAAIAREIGELFEMAQE